jgi:hypothetical protein
MDPFENKSAMYVHINIKTVSDKLLHDCLAAVASELKLSRRVVECKTSELPNWISSHYDETKPGVNRRLFLEATDWNCPT